MSSQQKHRLRKQQRTLQHQAIKAIRRDSAALSKTQERQKQIGMEIMDRVGELLSAEGPA